MKKIYLLFNFLFSFYFSNASDYYWVDGTGFWSDYANHWATTSGGSAFHIQEPTSIDNVYFDANSFTTTGDTVYFFPTPISIGTLDFTGVRNSPVIAGTPIINIYGSFIAPNDSIIWGLSSGFVFKSSSTGNIINASGVSRSIINNTYPPFKFDGTGSWDLQSDLILQDTCLTCGNNIYIYNGTLNSNKYKISCDNFSISSGKVMLNGSEIYCDLFEITSSEISDFDSSLINCGRLISKKNITFYDMVIHTFSQIDSCKFHDVTALNIYNSNYNVFHNVILNSLNSSATYNSFNKIIINKSVNLAGEYCSIDTLIFNNPGGTVIFSSMPSFKVNNCIIINSSPTAPIIFKGLGGKLSFPGMVCTDYISLQNLVVEGGGQFFAGDHSTDLGGNTGWSFTSCTPTLSNVWPGDANYDLIVDNLDLLNIGIAYGDTGYTRSAASNSFTAQPCLDWLHQFINGINFKKADSDGNGLVDDSDTLAVSMNYGLTHPFRIVHSEKSFTSGVDLTLQIPGGQINPGTNISVPIFLGTTTIQAQDVYGIAFSILYNQNMIQPGSMNVDFTNSWIDDANNHLNLIKDFSSVGRCDVAFTRIDHVNVTGNGFIGNLNFTTSNTASGYLELSLTKIKVISQNEIEIPINARTDSTVTGISEIGDGFFTIYPNPSAGHMKIYFKNNNHKKYRILIYDSQGKIILNELTQENNLEIVEKYFSAGVYLLSLTDLENGKQIQGKIIFN